MSLYNDCGWKNKSIFKCKVCGQYREMDREGGSYKKALPSMLEHITSQHPDSCYKCDTEGCKVVFANKVTKADHKRTQKLLWKIYDSRIPYKDFVHMSKKKVLALHEEDSKNEDRLIEHMNSISTTEEIIEMKREEAVKYLIDRVFDGDVLVYLTNPWA